jgi:hypothetical protein
MISPFELPVVMLQASSQNTAIKYACALSERRY